MYEAHFGLRQRPFRPTPDPAAYYPAAPHEDALNALLPALRDGDGVGCLTAEPGLGKTLLATVLLERLADEAGCVFVPHGHLGTPAALLQAILFDLGLPYESAPEQELRLRLTDTLLARLAEGRRTVVVLDEAHHLPPPVLEELRLLGNLETRQGKAVQAVLVGLPELRDTLKRPELRALAQRLTVRAALAPLDLAESADYVVHQLRFAGARPEAVIADDALELIAKAAHGVPRLLNQAAHQALALACQVGAGKVDAEAALEALARLGLEAPAEDEPAADAESGEPPYLLQPPGLPPRLVYAPGRSG